MSPSSLIDLHGSGCYSCYASLALYVQCNVLFHSTPLPTPQEFLKLPFVSRAYPGSMATTPNPTLIYSPKPSVHFTKNQFYICSNFFRLSSSSRSGSIAVKCSNPVTNNSSSEQSNNGGGLKNLLSGIVDERVDQLLNSEENRAMLDGLDKATQRVELAKRELAQIEKQEMENQKIKEYINQLESRASEIEECQKELSEARALVEEAERSLEDEVGDKNATMTETEREAMYKNKERFESVKAASISAIVGTIAGLPISLSQATDTSQLILPSVITLISCALFGVTFRYAVRRDLDNFQLKTGTSAAFGFVKGLATLAGGPPMELEAGSILSHAITGAVYVSENLLIFLFAGVGLDFCIKLGILSPFPIEPSASTTKMD
ncbi:hypothetical protein L2E82_06553 [Cichorium intybus]|uniref:Uncharacterized protein n=1 Tax=Cichorium intybus TaxID=13427 RepID=A0ACB9HBU6_CICIN|nr:hypothetical protein L2E82_06553 [Cichorium intybus]